MTPTYVQWWHGSDYRAHWRDRHTLEVIRGPSGWCVRLLEANKELTRSFPYDDIHEAIAAAERLAFTYWGDFDPKYVCRP